LQNVFDECALYSKYVDHSCRAEIYAGRLACCPLVSHVEYEPRAVLGPNVGKKTQHAILRYEKDGTDKQTDGHQTDALRLLIDAASV